MSLNEVIEPTRERIRRGDIQGTRVDQKTDRRQFYAMGTWEKLLKEDSIKPEHYRAAAKLYRHNLGAMGVDVRNDDDAGGDTVVEYSRTYHAQKMAEALGVLTRKESWAIVGLLNDAFGQRGALEYIGRVQTGWSCRHRCKGFGQSLVQTALERIADRWGLPLPEH
jgi:hypothetical protein